MSFRARVTPFIHHYDWHVRRFHLGETDLNACIVRQGQAVASRRYSREYVSAEEATLAEAVVLLGGGGAAAGWRPAVR